MRAQGESSICAKTSPLMVVSCQKSRRAACAVLCFPEKSGLFELACSPTEETDDKKKPFQRRTDHWDIERAAGWAWGEGVVPQARCQRCDVLQMGSKYGGMEVSDAKKLKALEAENAKLK